MQLPSVWRLLLGLSLILICVFQAPAQQNLIATRIADLQEDGVAFTPVEPFTILHSRNKDAVAVVPDAQFLTLNDAVLSNICQQRPEAVTLKLPYHGNTVEVDLMRVEVTSADFTVISERSPNAALPYHPGVHYRGVLKGTAGVASISFFDHEVMGVIGTETDGNLVLGKLAERGNEHQYIFYSDNDMLVRSPFSCYAPEVEVGSDEGQTAGLPSVDKCVRVFLEADNELFIEKGSSVQNTVNYLLGMYNQVAALYSNEQINTVVSQIFVWTTADIYTPTSSATVLDQFRAFRTQFNGDLAHLVGMGGNNLGGIAYVDVLCTPYNVAFSDIAASYSNVPTYSWTVEVVTHEMGHNLGSRHTQWCGWQGGPIDNCVSAEGSCSPGPTPTGGGTIMSYCHLTGVGINFNNGFGPQPGNTIRTEVANATCLSGSCPVPGSCIAPVAITVTNLTGTSAVIGWESASGATDYVLRYRVAGSSAWTTINTPSNPYTLTGLVNNEEYEVTVQSLCGSAASDYKNGVLFKTGATGGGGASCGTPTGFNVIPATYTASASWNAVTGASSYQIQWQVSGSATWGAAVSATTNSYSMTGLTASTNYNVRVSAVCNGTSSAFASASFATNAAGTSCGTPTNLVATPAVSSAQVTWSAVGGAVSYQIQWKLSTSSTWSSIVSVNTNSYTISGLVGSSTYNVRVAAVCSSTTSSFATATFTTSASVSCGDPANVVVTPSSTSAQASWAAVAGAAYYQVQWKTVASSTWGTAQVVSGTTYSITGLTVGTSYQFQVRTVCSSATSVYVSVNFTTTSQASCGTPSSLSIVPSTTTAQATWTGVNGAVNYRVQWKSTLSGNWSALVNVTGTSYTISGLTSSTGYNFRVQSVCSGASSSYTSNTFTTLTSGSSCGAPANLSVTPSTTTAQASWMPVSGAAYYLVQQKVTGTSTWSNAVIVTGTNYTIMGMTSSSNYDFRVQTACSNGVSSYTTTTFTTLQAGSSCGTPGNISVSYFTGYAQVNWNAVSGASYYEVQWKLSSSASWGNTQTVSYPYIALGNLTGLASYSVRIRAVCSTGTSSYASTLFTMPVDGSGSCTTPTNLAAGNLTPTTASVYWDAVTGALSYTIRLRVSGSASWFTFSGLPSAVVNVQNLNPATSYQAMVLATCSSGSSAFTSAITFTTPGSIVDGSLESRSSGNPYLLADDGDVLVADDLDQPSVHGLYLPVRAKVVPNPTRGQSVLLLDQPIETFMHIAVTDAMGRVVHTGKSVPGVREIELDIESEPSGVYLVKGVSSDGHILSLRIVKL